MVGSTCLSYQWDLKPEKMLWPAVLVGTRCPWHSEAETTRKLPTEHLALTGTHAASDPDPTTSKGTRYLGLYLTTDHNTHPIEEHLWQKALLYTMAFQRTPMSHHEVGVLYHLCFIPALAYPLLATWLPDQLLKKPSDIYLGHRVWCLLCAICGVLDSAIYSLRWKPNSAWSSSDTWRPRPPWPSIWNFNLNLPAMG